ncbi:outer membrane beta-barrel protein [Chitinophaga sp. S165]|uniref:outer membrane beta-barrel protein n=1 Tax=Chitinophaga sp. S165 TaxID=2135462 RepID=UPI000D71B387|nr:outer membrane beta-barrel protein [Chitinophaga sp. S165]PWV54031.1 outer membrane protein with beta-barrel domain [Chitinophaga sp. S165]
MKKLFFSLGLMAASFGVFAQDAKNAVANTAMGAATHSKDFLVIQLGYVGLTGTGAGAINTGFNRQLNIAFMYDIPLQKTNFSLAAGLGIGSDHYHLSDMSLDLRSASTIPNFDETDAYSKFKLATTYLEIPLELRYRQVPENANKGFKVGVGLKIGNLLNAHTRSVSNVNGSKLIEKEASKRLFNTWRFAGTARVGYGNFALYGTYALNGLFKDNGTYDVNPYSFGFMLSGL